jgi:serine/threonine-protein phosphatase 2B regulatory subunit
MRRAGVAIVGGVRSFAPASSDAKVRFSFRLYAQRDAERISPADLRELLAAVLAQSGVALSAPEVDSVVRLTFAQHDADKDGFISYAEYAHMCAENPAVLRNLTINVQELISSA